MLVKHVAFVGELLHGAPDEVPMLGETGRRPQCALLAAAADADGRVGSLHGLRVAAGARQLKVPSRERRRVLTEEPDDHLARLLEAVTALARAPERNAVGTGFLLVPTGADPDLEATARDDVERRRHIRQHGGVPIVDACYERA